MSKPRRENEAFGIAFLDVITCGFGAIILLLMIAKPGELPVPEIPVDRLDSVIEKLQSQLFKIRDRSSEVNQELDAKQKQLSGHRRRVTELQQKLAATRDKLSSTSQTTEVRNIIKGELDLALQELTDEMQRLLARRKQKKTDYIGGIPVDSEYIIFIIDTSGSMFQHSWPKMIEQLVQTLDVYPQVKGIQILNDMGDYMFSQYRGKWIPDTPGRRKIIVSRLRNWNPFSNSSPVEGITRAIRSFYSPDKKISLYVFGDEFSGNSIHNVVEAVDRLNPKDGQGKTQVRIHAVGFPVQFANPPELQLTGIRFATLMRELTRKNNGAFVGLNDFR